MQAARSRHSGGVITARCDGSVHWMSDDVFIGVWRALGTAAGGEPEPGL
jgi:prepilin-type processing-associated H-X9-DG protein